MKQRKIGEDHLAHWVEPISKGALLGGLDTAAIKELLRLADFVELPAGQTLMRQGDAGDFAYLVLDGEIEVIAETPLGEVVVATLGPQQIVGETSVFSDAPRTATVRTRAASTLMRLSGADLAEVITRHPKAALGLLSALGRRVAALNRPLAMLNLAAQALERSDMDIEAMTKLFSESDNAGPFGQSLRKLMAEIEGKQSRRQEMLVAARLQQSILPHALDFASQNAPYAVEALMRPSREIGGDFYDFFLLPDQRKAVLVVADVSGKGIPAALFMAVSRTLLRATVMTSPSIEDALTRTNAQLELENPECLFVTIFVAELDLNSGALRYVNAGHCEGYVARADGSLDILPANAPAVALAPRPRFIARSVTLGSGDLLMLVSDGVTEAFSADGAIFGEPRLEALLQGLSGRGAREALVAVDQAVTRFAADCEQSDDITCLALACL